VSQVIAAFLFIHHLDPFSRHLNSLTLECTWLGPLSKDGGLKSVGEEITTPEVKVNPQRFRINLIGERATLGLYT
jgi:hypothetical protein